MVRIISASSSIVNSFRRQIYEKEKDYIPKMPLKFC
jgi:hypothetical protein